MANARAGHTTTLLPNGKVLVVGGNTGNNSLTTAEIYNPTTGTWSSTGSLAEARAAHTTTLLPNGKVLVVGGQLGAFPIDIVATAELYDPATGAWSSTSSLAQARASHTATLLPNGKLLVVGGHSEAESSNTVATAELYDPATGAWSSTGSLAQARASHTAILLPNGKVLVVGGGGYHNKEFWPHVVATAELYDPATGAWSSTGALTRARVDHTATLLPNGKLLVVGGYSGHNNKESRPPDVATAELYDPATRTWSSTGSLTLARADHTATLLPNGKVLVVGGYNNESRPHVVATAELYDPATGTWSSAGSLAQARTSHTATLLPNGKLLVVGGYGGCDDEECWPPSLATAELYDPRPPRPEHRRD